MSRRQRLALLAAIWRSAVATIDGSIVNVALSAIERNLGGGLAGQQAVANAYLPFGIGNPRRDVEAAPCAGGRLVGAPHASLPQQA
jgi:hypothetical protein